MNKVIVKKQLKASQSLMLGYTRDLICDLLSIEIKAVKEKGGEEMYLKVLERNKDIVKNIFNNCRCTFQPRNPVEVTRGVLTDFLTIIDEVIAGVKGEEFQKETVHWCYGDFSCSYKKWLEIGKALAEELLEEFN